MPNKHVIIGTAGHIDHGKTSLVRALTGFDTDRHPEEKERGMTIDLGFAHLDESATIIDVPGHEKFIKNMVAGVSTIDFLLFVIAADDGVMPQTREHLDICRLLQVKRGMVALTKIDLVEPDWVELVRDDLEQLLAGTFLEGAPIFPVSTVTGEGIPELKQAMAGLISQLPQRQDRGVFWMPVDRAFTMKGFGSVITGSVLSGEIAAGQEVELLPEGRRARIRGLQCHGREVDRVRVGERAAINLQGVAKDELHRGQVITLPGYFSATSRINCRLQLLPSAPAPLKRNSRIRVHLGTAEIMARAIPLAHSRIEAGQEDYVQLRLERPAAARRLDPLVIRRYSPPLTIGGGVVLDAEAPPLRRRDPNLLNRLQALEKEDPVELLTAQLLQPDRFAVTLDQLAAETGSRKEELQQMIEALIAKEQVLQVGKRGFIHRHRLQALWHTLEQLLEAHHEANPMALGFRKAEIGSRIPPLRDAGLLNLIVARYKQAGDLKERDDFLALAHHEIRLTAEDEALRQTLAQKLHANGFAPDSPAAMAAAVGVPEEKVTGLLNVMAVFGEVTRIDDGIWLHRDRLAEARNRLTDYFQNHQEITVSEFKQLLGDISRKFAMPLIQYFDSKHVTERHGDVRVLTGHSDE